MIEDYPKKGEVLDSIDDDDDIEWPDRYNPFDYRDDQSN